MNTLLSLMVTLLPLVLGLAAWVFGAMHAFAGRSKAWRLVLSWMLCAGALWCPIQAIARWVEHEDIAAVLDCTHAYFLCATALLVGNLLLTVIGLLRKTGSHDSR